MTIDPPGAVPPSPQMMGELQPTVEPMGIASMVTGILSLVTCCCYPVSGFLSLVATGLGIASILRINKSPQTLKGKGFSLSGVIMGAIGLLTAVVLMSVGAGMSSGKFDQYLPKDVREQMEKMREQQERGGALPTQDSVPVEPSDRPSPGDDDAEEPATDIEDPPEEKP